jgi:hypothetical protein
MYLGRPGSCKGPCLTSEDNMYRVKHVTYIIKQSSGICESPQTKKQIYYISNTPTCIVCTDRHMWIVIVSVKHQPYRMKRNVIIIKYKGIPCQSRISPFLENGSLWYYWNYVESQQHITSSFIPMVRAVPDLPIDLTDWSLWPQHIGVRRYRCMIFSIRS